jgi:aminocarboxymuconate-semialdehyde decarboxylase
MQNRREFFKTVAGAAAGAYVAGRELPALAQRGGGGGRGGAAAAPAGPVKRKEISIGGKRVTVIDVHSHCTVDGVTEVVKGTPFERQAGGRALGADRIALIDGEGIDIQVLTINGYWWWEVQDRDLANRIVRAQNEGLARWVSDHKDRFVALTSVSLQFPDLAAEQLDYGVKQLGLRGATIGGHVNGQSPSDQFDPFWAKANELGVIVFMHPGGADNIIKTMHGRRAAI